MLAGLLWHSVSSIPISLVLVASIVALVLWLYPAQLRLLTPRWRLILPSLRVAGLCVLAVSIIKPVLVRPKTSTEQGSVLVLVDHSRSMGVIDESRTAAQKLALADALGQVHDRPKVELASALMVDIEVARNKLLELRRADSELDYARLSGRGQEAAQKRSTDLNQLLIDTLKRLADRGAVAPNKAGLPEKLTALVNIPEKHRRDEWLNEIRSRLDRVAGAVGVLQNDSDEQWYRSNTDARVASNQLGTKSRLELAERVLLTPGVGLVDRLSSQVPMVGLAIGEGMEPVGLRSGGKPAETLNLRPDADHSDLLGAVRTTLERGAGSPIRAIVLLTDGRQVGGESATVVSSAVSGVPIFPVSMSVAGALRDISIARMTVSGGAFVGETLTVRADLHSIGFKNTAVSVACTVGTEVQNRSVTVSDDKDIPIEFSYKLKDAGIIPVVLEFPPVKGESSPDNNRVQRWVKVMNGKVQMAVYAGSGAWDYQYLRNALSRTAWVKLQDGILVDSTAKFPLDPEQILKQDVVLLYDVAIASLSEGQLNAINQLVTERGGSVILIAGDAHLPAEYSANLLAGNLLPMRSNDKPTWRVWPGESPGYRIIPAPSASKNDVLKLADEAEVARRRWQELSPVYRFLQLTDLKPNVTPLLVEAESNAPVLTESRLGLGRVFFIGINESWRWRYQVGERDQDRFWLQLARYAAEEPYAVNNERYSLDADRVQADPNQPIRVRARARDTTGGPSKQDSLELRILRNGAMVGAERMRQSGQAGAGRFEADLTNLAPGDYQLSLEDNGPVPGVIVPIHVASSSEAEMADLSGDEKLLRRLADASGGEMIRLEQFGSLPDKISAVQTEQSKFAESSLWDSPWLFCFVLACFVAEWAMRKRLGLA